MSQPLLCGLLLCSLIHTHRDEKLVSSCFMVVKMYRLSEFSYLCRLSVFFVSSDVFQWMVGIDWVGITNIHQRKYVSCSVCMCCSHLRTIVQRHLFFCPPVRHVTQLELYLIYLCTMPHRLFLFLLWSGDSEL
jgi:hypothetical protein